MALNNLAVLETYLKDIIFSEEEIQAKIDVREHIFEIKNEDHSLGFISLYDLKAYVFEHVEEARSYSVKNIDSDEWKNIFEHPFFQRRKPQLLSTESLKDADDMEFYILSKGQKIGPYEKYELLEMVEKREILLTDMASFNGGLVWSKLYQVDGFDRRTLRESDQLPGMPSSEFLNRPSEAVNNIGETTDAITSLAFLGNLKRGKSIEREKEVSYHDEMTKKAGTSSIYKWMLLVSVIGIVYFLYNIRASLTSPFGTTPVSAIGEQAEMLSPVEDRGADPEQNNPNSPRSGQIYDQGRSSKFQTRRMNPVRPATARKSFMDTKKYQDSVSGDQGNGGSEDSNYYYDNASPMELDPVRAQISKENFDNGGEPVPAPDSDTLFNQEISN